MRSTSYVASALALAVGLLNAGPGRASPVGLIGTGVATLNGVEDSSISAQVLATFTDTAGSDPVANYSATINWGDGTPTSAGTIVGGVGNPFSVQGTAHTYVEEGTYTLTVMINDTDGASTTVTDTSTVADAPLLGSPVSLAGVASTPFSGKVGGFVDTNAFGQVSDFTATINWGDGTPTSAGTIVVDPAGGFDVDGLHTYLSPGDFTLVVTTVDDGGATTTTTGPVTISAAAPEPASLALLSAGLAGLGAIRRRKRA